MKWDIAGLLGPKGDDFVRAAAAGLTFLECHSLDDLYKHVGTVIKEVPAVDPIDKDVLQKSYGGGTTAATDDLLVGRGPFYITEQRKLFLDCTSGHYQMVWGYNPPELVSAAQQATQAGIVWDNHSNIPQAPVKRLAQRLTEICAPLDTVLLGTCTGSVACAAALKMQLVRFERLHGRQEVPVLVVMNGNYHGTDMVAQHMRGMWPQYVTHLEIATVEPNDAAQLEATFARYGRRVAAFWAEPIMMNREAILLQPSYLQLARKLCDQADAAMCIDEIQTGFWQGEIFMYRTMGIVPDMVIAGKGMTAGFHPLSGVVYKRKYDCLEQYDAISTNGQAGLASLVSLCNIQLIQERSDAIAAAGRRHEANIADLARKHPNVLLESRGQRHMSALKFRDRRRALAFHKLCLHNGLWLRAHAYHEGHSTVLSKLILSADDKMCDFLAGRLDQMLGELGRGG